MDAWTSELWWFQCSGGGEVDGVFLAKWFIPLLDRISRMDFKKFDSILSCIMSPTGPAAPCWFSYTLKANGAVVSQQEFVLLWHSAASQAADWGQRWKSVILKEGISKWRCGKGHICILPSISSAHMIRQELRPKPHFRRRSFTSHNFAQ